MSGVSASAVDSEGAVVPEPEVCARVGEGPAGDAGLGAADHLAGASEDTWGRPSSGPQERGGQAAVSAPSSCGARSVR